MTECAATVVWIPHFSHRVWYSVLWRWAGGKHFKNEVQRSWFYSHSVFVLMMWSIESKPRSNMHWSSCAFLHARYLYASNYNIHPVHVRCSAGSARFHSKPEAAATFSWRGFRGVLLLERSHLLVQERDEGLCASSLDDFRNGEWWLDDIVWFVMACIDSLLKYS